MAGVVGEELGNGDFPTREIKIKGQKRDQLGQIGAVCPKKRAWCRL